MRQVLIFSAGDVSPLDATCVGSTERVVVRDESSAVRQARERQPRVTIVDADTPGAIGFIRRLRMDPRTRDTGIVALSATADLSDESELRSAGANLVLARPFDVAHWDGPIRRLLDVPPRRAGRLPASFEIWDGPDASSRRRKGTALNISVNGVLLECRRGLPIGTRLDIVLTLPSGEVRGLAEVVRSAGGSGTRYRAGLQFLVLRGDAAARISAYVTGGATSSAAAPSHPAESAQWEAELRGSEARLRGVLDSAPDAVVLFDHQGRASEINRAAEELFECQRHDVLGRPGLDRFVPDPLRQIFRCALAHQFVAAQHLLGRRIDVDAKRRDGSPFTAELTFTRFTAKGCTFWALFARDVTERRRLTDELQASQRRFRTLVENSADGIALLENDGRFRYLTSSAASLLGYVPAELVGQTADALVTPEGVREARQMLRRSLEAPGGAVTGVLPCRHRDGSSRAIELVVVNHLATPEVGAIVVNYRDVTHRARAQQLEEELRQSQKIEALGRLAGGVAHDFNNLLGVILGASRLAITEGGDATRRLEQVQRAAEKAAALTHQLLAFSRKQVMLPEVLDVSAILRELGGMFERLVGEPIEVTTTVAPGLARVRADRSQLEQALMNLVVNARDAMPDGGRLAIEARNVELDAAFVAHHVGSRGGAFVQLTVTDTGVGMDAETQRRVFEPFFTTKERGKGTGLGLATTYGIVKQSGGYIAVQSAPGAGSRFDIYLPRVEAHVVRATEPARGHSAAGGETILLVEDDPMLRGVAADILTTAGYSVLQAANGDEALAVGRAHDGALPLLVADIVMPGMSGRQLAERLLGERPEMRVLYISGYTDDEILRHGIVEGTVDLLEKPFSPEALADVVRRLLDRGTRREAAAG